MKNNPKALYGILIILLLVVGTVVFKAVKPSSTSTEIEEEEVDLFEDIAPADESLIVDVTPSTTRDNAVVISVSGLNSNYTSVEYELTYDSEGIIQGVNSGSKPISVKAEDSFEREVYLGTCSKNVCRPHAGVESVSLILQFTDLEDKKSQFEGEFEI